MISSQKLSFVPNVICHSYVFINIPTLSILKLFMQANDVEKLALMNDKICPFSHLRFWCLSLWSASICKSLSFALSILCTLEVFANYVFGNFLLISDWVCSHIREKVCTSLNTIQAKPKFDWWFRLGFPLHFL